MVRGMMRLAESLGMTAWELAGRMTPAEYRLWEAEYYLRAEDRRDAEMLARARMNAGSNRG